MNKTLEDDTAYPIVISETNVPQWGLSKRERFAAMAMQGCLANGVTMNWEKERIARLAIIAADELIKALNETK